MGVAFSTVRNGFTKAPYILAVTVGKLGLDAFVADGVEDEFTLSQATFIRATTTPLVAEEGVILTAGFTITGAGVVDFTSAPTAGHKIMVEYEYDD
jgi:hypothetical protein